MGTRGKIVDVIHHLSPKVPIISLRYFTLDVEFLLRYDARLPPNILLLIMRGHIYIYTGCSRNNVPI